VVDPERDKAVELLQFPPKGCVATFTTSSSNQTAVAFPFTSTTNRGEEALAFEILIEELQLPPARREAAMIIPFSTHTATAFAFGSIFTCGSEASFIVDDSVTGGLDQVTFAEINWEQNNIVKSIASVFFIFTTMGLGI
jgi:hypothetical protein